MTALDKALDNMERDVPSPRINQKLSSFSAQVKDLSLLESCAKLEQIDSTLSVSEVIDTLPAMRHAMRKRCDPAVARASVDGKKFTIEVTDFQTIGRAWFVIGIVTRLS